MDAGREAAAAALDAFASKPKRDRDRRGRRTVAQLDSEVGRVEQRLRDGDWADLRPGDVVAVHAFCHVRLYDTHDGGLVGDGWKHACVVVGSLVKREFGGEVQGALEFARWAWQRERRREEKRRADGADGEGRRLSWRLLFATRHVLTDYRVDQGRQAAGGRRRGR